MIAELKFKFQKHELKPKIKAYQITAQSMLLFQIRVLFPMQTSVPSDSTKWAHTLLKQTCEWSRCKAKSTASIHQLVGCTQGGELVICYCGTFELVLPESY